MALLGKHEFLIINTINCLDYNLTAVTLCYQQIDPNIPKNQMAKAA